MKWLIAAISACSIVGGVSTNAHALLLKKLVDAGCTLNNMVVGSQTPSFIFMCPDSTALNSNEFEPGPIIVICSASDNNPKSALTCKYYFQ